jgi:hypothetical protein
LFSRSLRSLILSSTIPISGSFHRINSLGEFMDRDRVAPNIDRPIYNLIGPGGYSY